MYEQDHLSLSWLRCNTDDKDKSLVDTLCCQVCRQHEEEITSMKNFSHVWIVGSTHHKTSNVLDHFTSEQHKAAMILTRKASNKSVTSYSPIAKALLVMDEAMLECMKKKFDISYVIVKENLAFKNYPALYELKSRHGVDLGHAYKTKDSAKNFTHYIAESQRLQFIGNTLSECRFYSFLMDGSTDAGNVEDELIIIMYSRKDVAKEEVRSCARFLSVEVPKRADASGLIDCLGNALQVLGIDNVLDKASVLGVVDKFILIGGGTDGASVNVSD